MRLTMIAAGLALAFVGLLLVPAPAQAKKTEAEELAELQAKVTEKYVTEKKGMLFKDFVYWVDMDAVGDSRWTEGKAEAGPEKDPQFVAFSANYAPSIDATPDQQISLIVWRYRHVTVNEGAANSKHSLTFTNTGESVENSDVKGLCDAQRKNWMATAKDVDQKATVEVKKKKLGEAKFMAAAEGADAESGIRERREWYGWINGKRGESYVVAVTYGRAMMEKTDKVEDFVKGIKIVSETK